MRSRTGSLLGPSFLGLSLPGLSFLGLGLLGLGFLGLSLLIGLGGGDSLEAQERSLSGRETIERLEFPPLSFEPFQPELHTLENGIQVVFHEDRALPLVNVFARFQGGPAHFPRDYYAAASALPFLVRNGGTTQLIPDSVDARLAYYAIQTSVGGGSEGTTASYNVLSEHAEVAMDLWSSLIRTPRFDSSRVEGWRSQQLDLVRRRRDDPSTLAITSFNHLMYGDHPVGWTMSEEDLDPARLGLDRLRWLHERIFCPQNLILGVTGDLDWAAAEALLEPLTREWPSCVEPLPELPIADIRVEPGVFLLEKDLDQSTVVVAHATDVRLEDDPEYFASRVGNSIVGSNGLVSRMMSRLRTEEGFAYSASSLWTTPRMSRGLVGAMAQTRSENTIATTRIMLDIFEQMRTRAPDDSEVEDVVAQFTNGFVFNFETPTQVVSRRMQYEVEGTPPDWLQRYLVGLSEVTPTDVLEVFRTHVRPQEMIILILGNPETFDEMPEALGPLTILPISGN